MSKNSLSGKKEKKTLKYDLESMGEKMVAKFEYGTARAKLRDENKKTKYFLSREK